MTNNEQCGLFDNKFIFLETYLFIYLFFTLFKFNENKPYI